MCVRMKPCRCKPLLSCGTEAAKSINPAPAPGFTRREPRSGKSIAAVRSAWRGRRWYLTQTLVDQAVGVTEVESRYVVHYRRTLIAEIDPTKPRSNLCGAQSRAAKT